MEESCVCCNVSDDTAEVCAVEWVVVLVMAWDILKDSGCEIEMGLCLCGSYESVKNERRRRLKTMVFHPE